AVRGAPWSLLAVWKLRAAACAAGFGPRLGDLQQPSQLHAYLVEWGLGKCTGVSIPFHPDGTRSVGIKLGCLAGTPGSGVPSPGALVPSPRGLPDLEPVRAIGLKPRVNVLMNPGGVS